MRDVPNLLHQNFITILLAFAILLAIILILAGGNPDPVSPVATPTIDSPIATDPLPDPSEPTATAQVLIGLTVEVDR